MRPPRFRTRLWHVMALVAFVAMIFGVYVWLFPPDVIDHDDIYHDVIIHEVIVTTNFAGHDIPHTSPMFWVVVCLKLAVLAGLIAMIVRAWKAVGRRIARKS